MLVQKSLGFKNLVFFSYFFINLNADLLTLLGSFYILVVILHRVNLLSKVSVASLKIYHYPHINVLLKFYDGDADAAVVMSDFADGFFLHSGC